MRLYVPVLRQAGAYARVSSRTVPALWLARYGYGILQYFFLSHIWVFHDRDPKGARVPLSPSLCGSLHHPAKNIASGMPLFGSGRRRVVGTPPADVRSVPADAVTRLSILARMAREKLKPWANEPLPDGVLPGQRAHEIDGAALATIFRPGTRWFKLFQDVGEVDGCGVLLLLGKLDIRGRGEIEPEELERFLRQVDDTTENMLSFLTMLMVLATLALTIAVPLVVWPHGSIDPTDIPSLGGGFPALADFYTRWLTSDALAVLHLIEGLLLSLSIYLALKATNRGLTAFSNLAIYAPDAESRVYFLFDNHKCFATVFNYVIGSIHLIILALIFLTARTSPPLSVCLAFAFLFGGLQMDIFNPQVVRPMMQAPTLNQLRIAREIVQAEGRDPAAAAWASSTRAVLPLGTDEA